MFVLFHDFEGTSDTSLFLSIPDFDEVIEKSLIELYYRNIAEGLIIGVYSTLPPGETAIPFEEWVVSKYTLPLTEKSFALLETLKNHENVNELKIC